MFLRETIIKRSSGEYRYWRLIKTYWDKQQKKVRHKTVAQLGKLKPEEIEFFKNTLGNKAGRRFCWEDLKAKGSFEYLSVAILDRIWRYWGLDGIIPPKAVEVLTINRCVSPESDYQVSRWYDETILPRILGITLNPTKIYRALDELYILTNKIQRHLYGKIKGLDWDNYDLIFYDITSTYFDQSSCELSKYGLSRDHRKDKKQILLALAVTKKGFPFYWKILSGNTADKSTVKNFVAELKNNFGIDKACLVMDRGMVSNTNLDKIKIEEFDYTVTLNKSSINKVEDMPWDYIESITEDNVYQKIKKLKYHSKRAYYKELNSKNGRRYIFCFNPGKFLTEKKDRLDKIESIKRYFDKKNKELSEANSIRNREILRENLKQYLEKRAAGKLLKFRLISKGRTFQISYRVIEEAVKEAGKLDGIYVIKSSLNKEEASTKALIHAYRGRMEIEKTFHRLKSFVELRPICHHNEERIKAHVTVCILAYLLNNTVMHMVRQKEDFEELTAQTIYSYLNNCKLIELNAADEKRLKLTALGEKQIRLTKILADESLLDEDRLNRLLK